jgi:hypothetical protein
MGGEGGWSRFLQSVEGWWDAAFPLAIALLCLDQRTPAFLVLLVWLVVRLVQQLPRHPLVAVFLLLLGAQAGQFVLERDLQPSSASDPLVIALGLVAMLGRSALQWRISLRWVALSIVPLAFWAAGQDPAARLDLPVGGINRLGFLLGIVQLAAWASIWLSRSAWTRLSYGALTVLSIPMVLQNGSRVTLLAPACAVLLALTCVVIRGRSEGCPAGWEGLVNWLQRRRRVLLLITAVGCAVVLQTVLSWYLDPGVAQKNVLSDRGRIDTALCWASQPLRRGADKALLGVGYNRSVQVRCSGKRLPAVAEAGRPEGLPHAHNLFAQVFAENGLLGLTSLAVVLGLLLWRLRLMLSGLAGWAQAEITVLFGFPLLVYLLLNGLVSSFQIFLMSNQLLIGLGLASFWPHPQGTAAESAGCHNDRVLSE